MPRRTAALLVAIALGSAAAAGCSSAAAPDRAGGSPSGAGAPDLSTSSASAPTTPAPTVSASTEAPTPSPASAPASVAVRGTVTDGLESPWGLAVLPGGDLLVSERDSAGILRVSAKDGGRTVAGTVPGVTSGGEGGLLGLALSPDFATDHRVYAYFSTGSDNRIARLDLDPSRPAGSQLGAPTVLFSGIPHGPRHNGGRIAFGPDGFLYVGTGDANDRSLAQDRDSLGGKILRLTRDGDPAPGNPFPGSPVWSLGHRNVQGLAWDPQGRLWASEFGQDTWDELNLITPGGNYGWPTVEGTAGRAGFTDPVAQWHTADASPSGIAFASGAVWVAALRGTRLWRVPVDGDRAAGAPQEFLRGEYGRLRTVAVDGDGTLLLVTDNTDGRGSPRPGDDRILRLDVNGG
ncbi:PQQ-dependent sugar dehydrogenase [Streptomyces sp. NRRL S-495]|uniref:PQQ-dependent sugar dehydrogenase n=1 Tax=Streptomyces sp. NRRL S-495 TaxID=1609133 RepID=UPI0005F8D584|nr:PQQ-dependent sugar dehydrogenase [Streptomyces sp. NRRL S-495]KJY29377.1 glucose sorbosone dehydrogenase [Streptomyces sp. NRRL S-495]